MTEIFETLRFYFTATPIVTYALIVGVLVSVCASLLGVTLVLKRLSFIGDGLSHVAFGAMAIATVLRISNDMLVVMPVTVGAAVVILCLGNRAKIKGDSAIAMVSVSAMAVGYLLMNVFPVSANVAGDTCDTLFGGSLITLSLFDVWSCIILSVVIIAVFVVFYNKLFAVTFDEDFAAATGIRVGFYNLVLSVIIAAIIVLAMNLVGSLLVSALVVFPSLAAMRVARSFKTVTACAATLSGVCSLVGILVSILADTPAGATIVTVDIAAFLVCALIGKIRR